jgi:hypothetical protein
MASLADRIKEIEEERAGKAPPKSISIKTNTPVDKSIRAAIDKIERDRRAPEPAGPEVDPLKEIKRMQSERLDAQSRQMSQDDRAENALQLHRAGERDDFLRPGTDRQAPELPKYFDSIYGSQIREKEAEQ